MSTREDIAPHVDTRYIRRDGEGHSLSDDARQKAKTRSKPGQGDRGDHHARSAFRA